MALLNFKFNTSFPKILNIIPIGVTTKKKIAPIIIGEINLPNNIPNLNQSLFNGVSNFELIKPKIKKKVLIGLKKLVQKVKWRINFRDEFYKRILGIFKS